MSLWISTYNNEMILNLFIIKWLHTYKYSCLWFMRSINVEITDLYRRCIKVPSLQDPENSLLSPLRDTSVRWRGSNWRLFTILPCWLRQLSKSHLVSQFRNPWEKCIRWRVGEGRIDQETVTKENLSKI